MESERERLVEELARLLDGESVAASELALLRAKAAVDALDAYLAARVTSIPPWPFSGPLKPVASPPQTPQSKPFAFNFGSFPA